MKKLSLYWKCQIAGWSVLFAILLFFYLSLLGFIWNFITLLFLGMLSGVVITHLMRLTIIKARILQLNILNQLIYILFTTIFFSFIYALADIGLAFILDWKKEILSYFLNKGNMMLLITEVTFNSCFILSIWNLAYFSYHYVKKSQREQIERIRFENELKIQQLENENSKLEFQKNITDVSLIALRSQMNPHFIFNCLNSIKLFTVENNNITAAEYLTKFSRLIRLVMENSVKEKILLSSELDTLQLYIEMEAMRFKEKLRYNITIEKNVETNYIELPPLLLQPYIENAIWHGLMPKEEGGRIDIDITMNNDKSLLEISIEDDGIGRAKSAALKSKTVTKHKSYGMKVTSERIALINQVYKTGADVTVYDLINNDAKPSGTKVIIKIPV